MDKIFVAELELIVETVEIADQNIHIFITGASSGIGYCAALEFLKSGYKLTLPDILACSGSDPCVDINECKINRHICGPNAMCQNTSGSFKCICDVGYKHTKNNICEDIDECLSRDIKCTTNELCINSIGSYICTHNKEVLALNSNYVHSTPPMVINFDGRVS